MTYVRVIVRHPNGEEYEAQVDTESQPEALLASLVENLRLDPKTTKYRFQLVNATKIEEGVTIEVTEDKSLAPTIGFREKGVCEWTEDSCEVWETSCGGTYYIIEGTPTDNNMRYCPFCGCELVHLTRQERSKKGDRNESSNRAI